MKRLAVFLAIIGIAGGCCFAQPLQAQAGPTNTQRTNDSATTQLASPQKKATRVVALPDGRIALAPEDMPDEEVYRRAGILPPSGGGQASEGRKTLTDGRNQPVAENKFNQVTSVFTYISAIIFSAFLVSLIFKNRPKLAWGIKRRDISNFAEIVRNYPRISFSGRASKKTLLVSYLLWIFSILFCSLLIIISESNDPAVNVFGFIILAVVSMPWLAVQVRRLHDSELSGWWLLMHPVILLSVYAGVMFLTDSIGALSPEFSAAADVTYIAGGIVLSGLLFWSPGSIGQNRYGAPPYGPDESTPTATHPAETESVFIDAGCIAKAPPPVLTQGGSQPSSAHPSDILEPYAIAGEEVLSGKVDAALWARALVQGGGSDGPVRAAYVAARVAQLEARADELPTKLAAPNPVEARETVAPQAPVSRTEPPQVFQSAPTKRLSDRDARDLAAEISAMPLQTPNECLAVLAATGSTVERKPNGWSVILQSGGVHFVTSVAALKQIAAISRDAYLAK